MINSNDEQLFFSQMFTKDVKMTRRWSRPQIYFLAFDRDHKYGTEFSIENQQQKCLEMNQNHICLNEC